MSKGEIFHLKVNFRQFDNDTETKDKEIIIYHREYCHCDIQG